MESEATGIQTNEAAVETTPEVTETITEQAVDAPATEEVTTTEEAATNPFSKEKLDWQDLDITDETKDALVNKYSSWFKNEESANAYLKEIAEAKKLQDEAAVKAEAERKEERARKIADQEAAWDKDLKTDPDFGRDYDVNRKRVDEVLTKFSTEKDIAELKKFNVDKYPAINRMLLKISNEFESARVRGAGRPAPLTSEQPVDRFGNTMFDFTKKQ